MMKPTKPDTPNPLTLLQLIGSILAAAVGVQSDKNRNRDFHQGRIVPFIIGGVLFTLGFVLVLIGAIKWATGV